ncbi:hypothetical protein [Streptomyces palmae]|uniref:Uncharacterized protein n=1 Tax=Streptomyces palmae TaxID=1701085 RepID=A0A4Z0H0F1_9ACTN|nr:hypothetical protein [Streptomyces palmae]TGB03039.1 hypothetical protein E4099_20190 [Streptomyces palmae]
MSESAEPTRATDPGDEPPCPGPHQMCRGCTGTRLVAITALYVPRSGPAGEMSSLTLCRACEGRGFFCRRTPQCRGPHGSTPMLSPGETPPV